MPLKHWEPQATRQVVETPISSVGFNINIKTPHIHTFYPRNSQDKVNQKTDSPVVKYFLLGDPQWLVRWFSSYPLIRFPGPVPVPPCCCWPTTTSWTPWSCGWPPQRRSMRPGGMAVYGCGVEFAILICTTSLGFFNYFFDGVCFIIHVFFLVCVCLFYYCISIHYIVFGCAISFCCMCFFWMEPPLGLSQKINCFKSRGWSSFFTHYWNLLFWW